MKVLYLVTRAERGGAQVHVSQLLSGLQRRHELFLAVGEQGYLTEEALRLGVATYTIRGLIQPMDPISDAVAITNLLTLLRRIRPDMVHAHTSKAGMVARLAAFIEGIPVVYTAHTWGFTEGSPGFRRAICVPVEKICAKLSAHIITVSDANRSAALRLGVGPEGRFTTIWNGVPDTPLRSKPGAGPPVRVLMVARFAEQKDHELLIRALASLREPFELVFVGDGPTLPRVKALAAALQINESVSFLGDQGNVAEILSSVQIFVLSTLWEGFPLSILEAMRAGLPVIATDVGGVREAVHDKISGLLVQRGNIHELALALRCLILNSGLRVAMGIAGRALYQGRFSAEMMLSKTEGVYQQVVSGQARKRHPELHPSNAARRIARKTKNAG